MTLDEEERRGFEAERVLNEPLLKEAFEKVEARLIESMKLVPMGDTKTQHELVLSLQLLGNVKKQIEEVAQTGKLAQVSKAEKAFKTVRRFVGR